MAGWGLRDLADLDLDELVWLVKEVENFAAKQREAEKRASGGES